MFFSLKGHPALCSLIRVLILIIAVEISGVISMSFSDKMIRIYDGSRGNFHLRKKIHDTDVGWSVIDTAIRLVSG